MNTVDLALLILRLTVGLTFAAHGAQKVFGWWGGPGYQGWQGAMSQMGFKPAGLFAAISAGVELIGGLALALGLLTPIAGAALIAQSVVIVGQVHWRNGFFSTKGGYEFPLTLGVAVAAIVLIGAGAWSMDAAIGFTVSASARIGLIALGMAAGVIALAVPRIEAYASSTDNPTAKA